MANRRKTTLADLIDEPWCVAPSAVGSLVTDAFRASGLRMPRIAVTTTTAHLLFQLLESGYVAVCVRPPHIVFG